MRFASAPIANTSLVSFSTMRSHIRACAQAMEDGVELMGYCPWSVMDLLSSHQGFRKRYGLIYVDRDDKELRSLRRIPKDSFYWYRDVIRNGGPGGE